MIVLGINGLLHDASMCLIKDGQVLSALEHERLTSFKNAHFLFPFEAVQVMIEEQGIGLNEIDCVAWNFDYRKFHLSGFGNYIRSIRGAGEGIILLRHYLMSLAYKLYQHFFTKSVVRALFMGTKSPWILFTPHHLAHFLYSYYASPYQDCAALIADGGGEYYCTTRLYHRDGKLRILGSQGMPADSLGILYSTGTFYLGFRPSADEYKVMGLASYGRPNARYKQFFDGLVKLKGKGRYEIDKSLISFPNDMLFTFTEKALEMLNLTGGASDRDASDMP